MSIISSIPYDMKDVDKIDIIGAPSIRYAAESASDAAEIICDKYENPDPNNSHIDERKADAESLFNVMIGED